MNYLTADFETTTLDPKKFKTQKEYREAAKSFKPEVYDWALCERVDYNSYFIEDGIGIRSFLHTVLSLKDDTTIYFHNGAKFDLHFLINFLTEEGFKQVVVSNVEETDISKFDHDRVYQNITLTEKPRKLNYGEFHTTVNGNHAIMELKLALPVDKRKKDHTRTAKKIIFRDTNLMFPSSLAGYGKTLNKHYKTDIWSKLEIDGGYTRSELYETYEEFVSDGNEQEYLHQDVKILSEFIYMMDEVLPMDKWKMTAAGTAYDIWLKEFYGKELLEYAIKNKFVKEVVLNKETGFKRWLHKTRTSKPVNYKTIIDILLDERLPTNWLDEHYIDGFSSNYEICQDAYQGGITMANPKHAGKKIKNLVYVDENSAYPGVMTQEWYPVGRAVIGSAITDDMLKLIEVDIVKVENTNGLPFVYVMNGTSKSYPLIVEDTSIIMTDVEFERFQKYYSGEYDYTVVCGFNKVHGRQIFGSYIGYFYAIKEQASKDGNEALKLYAKLMLNSLYGKYAQDIIRMSKIFTGEEDMWTSIETIEKPKYYLPLAVWITAHARMRLVDAVGERFEYCNYLDTDSLSLAVPGVDLGDYEALEKHFKEFYPGIELNPTKLGAWDIEYYLKEQITRRAKQYRMVTTDDKVIVKFAGLNMKEQDLENLKESEFLFGKTGIKQLRPMRLPTGLLLEEYDKQIPGIWNYDMNSSYWFSNEEQFKAGYKITPDWNK